MRYFIILFDLEDLMFHWNHNLSSIVTSVNVDNLEKLLNLYGYNKKKSKFLIDGFTNGFSLQYQGKRQNIRRFAPNLKFQIGNPTILWNKVMKEVKLKRYAGPFIEPPFNNFIQSPIGLVPKDGGRDTRLIFHLSYPRTGDSVNSGIPSDECTVVYPDFDEAVKLCISAGKAAFASKSDMASAFRHVPIRFADFSLLIMKAVCPANGITYYFVDKCLPFGSSISCRIFQEFSNAVSFIVMKITNKKNTSYLDDFFFIALLKALRDQQVDTFLKVCEHIGFPVSIEKTFYGSHYYISRTSHKHVAADSVHPCREDTESNCINRQDVG